MLNPEIEETENINVDENPPKAVPFFQFISKP